MTHKGDIESEREPNLRRCECLPWTRPTIENTEDWNLKFWRQSRQHSNNRVCIALETEDDTYFVILDVRETYVLLWTAFLSEYRHQSKKKLKEYEEWKKNEGVGINTPDELIALIQESIKKQEANLFSRLRNSFNCVVDELIVSQNYDFSMR